MTWLNICQGLVLLGWIGRHLLYFSRAISGSKAIERTGAMGVIGTIVWMLLSAAVIVRSGAVSTIVGFP